MGFKSNTLTKREDKKPREQKESWYYMKERLQITYNTLCHSKTQKIMTGKMYYNVITAKSAATRQYEMWTMSPSAWSVKHIPLHVGRKKPMGEKNFLFFLIMRIGY